MEYLNLPQSPLTDYMLSQQNLSPISLLACYLLGVLRIAPIVAIAPFMGAKVMPMPVRAGFAFLLGLVFLPQVMATATQEVMMSPAYLGLLMKELGIGLFLAFLGSIPFFIVQSSGIIIDFMRGSSQLMSQDPTMQNQVSSIGILYNYILIYMFFQLDGFLLFFDAVENSFSFISIDQFIPSRFFLLNQEPYLFFSELLGKLFALSIQLAAPCILAILMAEFFLGIANRLAPQVQIAFLGMSLKSLMGLFLLWMGWQFILKNVILESLNFLKSVNLLIDQLIKISHAK
ncbi:MAG: type III secretion protein [Chlamydiae bacterium]|nr:type III secretion protein [Chlamydiota bacterium]